jgi:hypothetical protein
VTSKLGVSCLKWKLHHSEIAHVIAVTARSSETTDHWIELNFGGAHERQLPSSRSISRTIRRWN